MDRTQYEGVSVTPNIEKHASAMLYPLNFTHIHPKYAHLNRLEIIKITDPYLAELYSRNDHHSVLIDDTEYYHNPFDYVQVKDINCTCDRKILYEQIFGDPSDMSSDAMAYKSCKHTIYAAAKRQMKMAPTPDPTVADDFLEYSKKIIENEIGEYLTHFGYSYQQWYNHLSKTKQDDMDDVAKYFQFGESVFDSKARIRQLKSTAYEGICKVEIQSIDGKPRMVCSIPLQTKYIMGPVCWALEDICAKHLHGYCGGQNLTQMAQKINHYAALGFTKVVEGDGSAFDNTQDITLKRVDHYLYKRIKDKVYHVDKEKFIKTATALYKTMDVVAVNHDTKKRQELFSYKILGSVFSGDCDTTLCNTIRMALYNRYVNDKAGLVFGQDYICFSKGDDFTVMYKPHISNEFIKQAYYKYFVPAVKDVTKPDTRVYGLGQVLKMLDFGGLDSIKFCSLRAWYKNKDEIILTRDPAKFWTLSKYSRKIKTMTNYQAAIYLLQQAEALYASYSGLNLFETMAKAYILAAKRFFHRCTAAEKRQYKRKYEKMRRKIFRKMKRRESIYNMAETEYEKIWYDIRLREDAWKIEGNYWEFMQSIERIRTDMLTAQEAEYVNRQIAMEFSTEELKSVLGLNKANEQL